MRGFRNLDVLNPMLGCFRIRVMFLRDIGIKDLNLSTRQERAAASILGDSTIALTKLCPSST